MASDKVSLIDTLGKTTMPAILYSFRRCPYAMRARMAIAYAGIPVLLREILLKDKPKEMLLSSPKGTVPVLILEDKSVLDESEDIMRWALGQNDPDGWLNGAVNDTRELILENDGTFKQALDKYKYADRFPEHSASSYRQQGALFLVKLEKRLQQSTFLMGESAALSDIAIFPFIRQFAGVDPDWFKNSPYPNLRRWLNFWVSSALFDQIMQKYAVWSPNNPEILFSISKKP